MTGNFCNRENALRRIGLGGTSEFGFRDRRCLETPFTYQRAKLDSALCTVELRSCEDSSHLER